MVKSNYGLISAGAKVVIVVPQSNWSLVERLGKIGWETEITVMEIASHSAGRVE